MRAIVDDMDLDDQHALTALVGRLAERFPAVEPNRIERDIAAQRALFEDVSVRDFVPVLIERQLVESYRQHTHR